MLPWWGWALVGIALLALLDQALLALERRGHIYWRRVAPRRGAMGDALMGIQGLIEPAAEHVVEERRRADAAIEVAPDDAPPHPRHRDPTDE